MTDEHHRGRGFTLIFIINGQDFPTRADAQLPLRIAVERALTDTGNTGRPLDEWEVRNANGVLLDTNKSPQELGLHGGARLFLSLRVGAGGFGQNRS